jgi:AcrR family transcriptional regulator
MQPEQIPSLRERKKAATKERIFFEALELFRRQGFASTTIEAIAEAADVSKGTFFNYFPAKEALLHYLGVRRAVAAAEALRGTLNDPDLSARRKLNEMLQRVSDNVERDRELTRLAVFEAMKAPDTLTADPYRVFFRQTIARLLVEGQQWGEVDPALDPEIAASAIMGVYLQQVFEWCAAEPAYSLTARVAQLADLMWRGMGTDRATG